MRDGAGGGEWKHRLFTQHTHTTEHTYVRSVVQQFSSSFSIISDVFLFHLNKAVATAKHAMPHGIAHHAHAHTEYERTPRKSSCSTARARIANISFVQSPKTSHPVSFHSIALNIIYVCFCSLCGNRWYVLFTQNGFCLLASFGHSKINRCECVAVASSCSWSTAVAPLFQVYASTATGSIHPIWHSIFITAELNEENKVHHFIWIQQRITFYEDKWLLLCAERTQKQNEKKTRIAQRQRRMRMMCHQIKKNCSCHVMIWLRHCNEYGKYSPANFHSQVSVSQWSTATFTINSSRSSSTENRDDTNCYTTFPFAFAQPVISWRKDSLRTTLTNERNDTIKLERIVHRWLDVYAGHGHG